MHFTLTSPTITEWKQKIVAFRAFLLNTKPQMEAVLAGTQADVDKQFDENQSKWKPLKPYTVGKKVRLNADPRILHETRQGAGLRLRDAYAQAGSVDESGKLIYTYPDSKPYAKEHQEGIQSDSVRKPRKKMSRSLAREMKRLDDEYENIFKRG